MAYQHINRLTVGTTRLSVCKPTGGLTEGRYSRTVIRSVGRTAGRLADKSMDKQTDG
ncbi:hypothetical protein [Bacteroides thetaiotaomicron]|uniref:hypothetical protein n=1 Tax=Bacteroides thetaiotaomicron TaxID=818 RepID=UPI001F443FAB|nr:hypothetical protein [Bacteroides thetaiotaomicron]MCE8967206.1 hypothetical protein [Bacteroides thetaiotaomicron]